MEVDNAGVGGIRKRDALDEGDGAPPKDRVKVSCESPSEELPPETITVTVVTNALPIPLAGNAWETIYHAAQQIRVLATPVNPRGPVVWSAGGTATGNPNERDYPMTVLGRRTVTASLATATASLTVDVVPQLTALAVPAPATGGAPYKAYVDAAADLTINATVVPNTAPALAYLRWNDGGAGKISAGASAAQNDAARDVELDYTVTVTIHSQIPAHHAQARTVDFHICQLPVLAIEEITFGGGNHRVDDDDGVPLIKLGLPVGPDNPEWLSGRAPAVSFPACYTRNTNISIIAKFSVAQAPTEAEQVDIQGDTAGYQWTAAGITVNPGDADVTTALMASNNTLPNTVDFLQNMNIVWQFNPAAQGLQPANNSTHDIYVTLGNPNGTPAYWTLLHISCVAAQGDNAANNVVASVFTPFTGLHGVTGANPRLVRKTKAPAPLKYWGKPAPAQGGTASFLGEVGGCGACGAWARLLIDMWKAHGITTGEFIQVRHTNYPNEGFLVKNWAFHANPVSTHNTYTHSEGNAGTLNRSLVNYCDPRDGLPGQNIANPPPSFQNHFIVWYPATGTYYDPSYGSVANSRKAWETAAIDGLWENTGGRAGWDTSKQPGGFGTILRFYNHDTNAWMP